MFAESQDLRLVVAVAGGHDLDLRQAFGQAERSLERLREPPIDAVTLHEAVDDDLDVVGFVAFELQLGPTLVVVAGDVGQVVDLAIDADTGKAVGRQIGNEGLIGALATANDRGDDLETSSVGKRQHPVDDLLRRLPDQPLAGLRIMRYANAGKEQSKVVVDLGDGADRRTRVA